MADAVFYLSKIAERLPPATVLRSIKTGSSEVYSGPCKVYWVSFYTSAQSTGEGDLRDGGSGSTQRFRYGVVGTSTTKFNHRHAQFSPPIHFTTNLWATTPSGGRITIGYKPD